MLTVIPPRMLAQNDDVSIILSEWETSLTRKVDAGEISQNTAIAYKRGAAKLIAWCEANQVREVTGDVLRDWKSALLKEGRKPSTVNAWLAGVRALFAWSVETKQLAYNPADGVKGAKRKGQTKHHAREALTDVEVKRVLDQAKTGTIQGKRDYAILSLMVYTGLRSVEVHRANLADVRTENGRLVLYVQGKGHDETDDMVVIANPKAQNAVYDWLAARGDNAGPLFTSLSDRSNGERLSLRAIRGMVKDYFALAGVRGNKTTHSLRHTAITKAILNGAPIQKVKNMARHQDINTTMIYFHEIDRLTDPAEAFIDYGE